MPSRKVISTQFKNIYIVQNYSFFRGWYVSLSEAVKKVRQEGYDGKTGDEYYQIYKCDVELKNIVPKNRSAKECMKENKHRCALQKQKGQEIWLCSG